MQTPDTTSAETRQAWVTLCTSLAAHGATAGKLFGMPCLKTEAGKAFAGLFGDALVFKLTAKAHAEALKLTGAMLFDPSGKGRPMKAWVVLPKAHATQWARFADAARQAR